LKGPTSWPIFQRNGSVKQGLLLALLVFTLLSFLIKPFYCNVRNIIKWQTLNSKNINEQNSIFRLTYIKNDDATTIVAQFVGDDAGATIAQVGDNVKMFFHVIGIDFVIVASFGPTTTIAQASS
jgi:hypothetical protein